MTIEGTPSPELVDAIASMNTRMTEVAALLRGLSLNNVLYGGSLRLDANGHADLEFTVPAAAVAVSNPTDASVTLTVAAGTLQAAAPAPGPGVLFIAPGHAVVLPITGRTLSFYGTPAGAVTVAVFSTPQPPSFSGGPNVVVGP